MRSIVPPHRSTARLIILDGEQSVLLVRYAEHRSGRPGSYWATPGGALEPEENAREAAARELQEETGIRAPAGRSLWTHTTTFELPEGWVEQKEVFFLVQLAGSARWWRRADLERTAEAVYPEGLAALLAAIGESTT
jgi:8-oxo-dGTP pyrophosphatase MutT (NUDIX family)